MSEAGETVEEGCVEVEASGTFRPTGLGPQPGETRARGLCTCRELQCDVEGSPG
jgi:hypothetical protein